MGEKIVPQFLSKDEIMKRTLELQKKHQGLIDIQKAAIAKKLAEQDVEPNGFGNLFNENSDKIDGETDKTGEKQA